MRTVKTVAVYCGSNFGTGDAFRHATQAFGRELVARGLAVVYGGTHMGLMGALADAVLEGGGTVHGVIPRALFERGHLHTRLTTHEIAADIATRKARMLAMADACIALPGGIGTVEEIMEVWTLNQLGYVDKPAGLFNIDGFFDPFLAFIDSMVTRGFLPPAHRFSFAIDADPATLIDALATLPPITEPKWIS
ncbi:MAG: TIGR00730 family Rossman fold protein [Pseudorhodoplanes sp.]|nr:LOG family protein YvdD [Pseudorhodoplanes sp.]MBW7949752.1 TIGR00730 family Rossman fold protein [Pseudorhodoplanes sp.]MCL4710244.1 TIGR00730 family Rossman fold protein [Pseudorhodoplanes sp.]